MKILLILLMIVMALIPVSAYAYTPPGQGTDNATDVILWNGDNVTIETANLTGTVSISGLNNQLETISEDYLAFVLVAFLIVLALWQGSAVLQGMAVPVSFVYGITRAAEETTYSPLWLAGVGIALIGLYLLFKIAADTIKKFRE